MVGEVFLLSTEQVAAYYGEDDELHMSFNFPPLFAAWEAKAWASQIDKTFAVLDPVRGWPTWVLSNHDQKRHRTRYGGEAAARAAAVLQAWKALSSWERGISSAGGCQAVRGGAVGL